MTTSIQTNPVRFRPLRIWPAALLVAGIPITRYAPRLVEGESAALWIAGLGPAVCGVSVLLWWLVGSRATWRERIAGVVGIGIAVVVTLLLVDSSMRGPGTTFVTVPMGLAGFGLGAILWARTLAFKRTVFAVLLAACGFGFSTLLRNDGMSGSYSLGLHWRWNPSPEQRMLARMEAAPSSADQPLADLDWEQALAQPEWPGFRGPDRTSSQHGPPIAIDWNAHPPKQLWTIPVGPAWSSFAVAGDFLFTQEQRGPMETVVCYQADTGREIWTHSIQSRFDDPLGGPGPRATPTLSGDGLFVMGAEGLLLRLDPRTGAARWQIDLREAAERQSPMWGFASSPLVVGSVVIVHAGGDGEKGTLAFDAQSGELRWSAPAGDHSYSSPQLAVVEGEEFVLMLTNDGLDLLNPQTGVTRLHYEWKQKDYRALQPQVVDGNTILVPTGMSAGTRRIRVVKEGDKLSAEEIWTSRNLKPDFNDFVVFQGHAYGFDGGLFACIDLATGDRDWKGGRYGKGQVLLLADSGLLLVASEQGDVVLLKANSAEQTELTKFKALEGKTWNHPVLVGDRLYVRNAQQAACYQLALAEKILANTLEP